MTAGQSAHPQTGIWQTGRISTFVAVAATFLVTVAIVAAIYFSGQNTSVTGAPAAGAPAYHLNDGTHGTVPLQTISHKAHAE